MEEFKERYLRKCQQLGIHPIAAILDGLQLPRPRDGAATPQDATKETFVEEETASVGSSLASSPSASKASGLRSREESVASGLEEEESATEKDGPTLGLRQRRPKEHRIHTPIYPTTLDLRAFSLPVKQCVALAEALAADLVFKKIKLTDALLGDDGCVALAQGLKTNTTCQVLDLRGNNLRSDGGLALAQLLKVNTGLTRLTLEWNNLGLWDEGIAAIADALTLNTTLVELDLRNNKLSAQNSLLLANALRSNRTLRKLDLRWNMLGQAGGRFLLDMLKHNSTLCQLELAGNDIPEDMIRAIDVALERNHRNAASQEESSRHTKLLSHTLSSLQATHHGTLKELTAAAAASHHTSRTLSKKLHKASIELEKSMLDRRALETQVEEMTAQLKAYQDKQLDAEEAEIRSRREWRHKWKETEKNVDEERKLRDQLEEKHRKEMNDMHAKLLNMEADLREAEVQLEIAQRSKRNLQKEMEKLESEVNRSQRQYDDKTSELEKTLSSRLDRSKASIEDEFNKQSQELKSRAEKHEASKQRLEQLVEELRTKLNVQRQEQETAVMETEIRVKREEHQRLADLDSQMHRLKAEMTKLTLQLQASEAEKENQGQANHQLQKQTALYKMQIKELQEQKQSLADKADAFQARESALQQQVQRLQEENQRWEFVSQKMREEEVKRMMMLDDAISHYIKSAQSSLTPASYQQEKRQFLATMPELQSTGPSLTVARPEQPMAAAI